MTTPSDPSRRDVLIAAGASAATAGATSGAVPPPPPPAHLPHAKPEDIGLPVFPDVPIELQRQAATMFARHNELVNLRRQR